MGVGPTRPLRFLYVTNIRRLPDLPLGNIAIYEITDPASPEFIRVFGEGEVSNPTGMAIRGNILYVANAGGDQTIEVYNISNPTDPVRLGQFGGFPELVNPNALTITGDTLYVTNLLANNVEIYDISNPNPVTPTRVTEFGSVPLVLNAPNGLAITGNILYISNAGDATVEIYNIANPFMPARLGQFGGLAEISHPIGLAIRGDILYVANFDGINGNTIDVYDISRRNEVPLVLPTNLGQFGAGQLLGPVEMAITDNILYVVSENDNTVQIYDISNPNPVTPTHLGERSEGLSVPFGLAIFTLLT
ncbi:LVIVD repeat-containing protein [Brevibacillus sp. H7]|uniref:LVIVD repeat-containing protein n=1 Tax=Brevibacillus sp. H7 TaxID=3349138 RepID=UPI00382F2D2D